MTPPIKNKTTSTDVELLTAILDVLTPAQIFILTDKLRQVTALGFGRVTITIHAGSPSEIQVMESFRFEDDKKQ